MCIMCSQTPCHPRCPNADEVIVDGCSQCYEDISAGNVYYKDDNGNLFCSMDCAVSYYGIEETYYKE